MKTESKKYKTRARNVEKTLPSSGRLLSRGAEATIHTQTILGKKTIIKTRVPKPYRHAQLDAKLRKERTMREAKLLHEIKKIGIDAPLLYSVNVPASQLIMEHVPFPRIKHALQNKKNEKKFHEYCIEMGKIIARLHHHGIIHGDLTTSNFLIDTTPSPARVYVIDLGLAFHSTQLEDQAVDLLNLKKTFEATHSPISEGWSWVTQSYVENNGKPTVIEKLKDVEKRIRYA
ncbi:MAG: KEOPS complex kinase/ATPase Bud32 [archaeon]